MKVQVVKRQLVEKETLYIEHLYYVQNGKFGVKFSQEIYIDIITTFFKELLKLMLERYVYEMPMRLGRLQIDKVKTRFSFNDLGIRKDATTYPIDPVATRANIEKGINKLVYDTNREYMLRMRWYKGEFKNRRAYYLDVHKDLETLLYKLAK